MTAKLQIFKIEKLSLKSTQFIFYECKIDLTFMFFASHFNAQYGLY